MATTGTPTTDFPADLPTLTATTNFAGEITGRPRYDTVDRSKSNIKLEPHEIVVHDARPIVDRLELTKNGFALFKHKASVDLYDDKDRLDETYHNEMADFIRAISGTPYVAPQRSGLVVRHAKGSAIKTDARPAVMVHMDYTEKTAREMADLVAAWEGLDIGSYRHFAIYQTWRAKSRPPQDSLLTLSDGRTVTADDYITVDSIVGPEDEPGNVFEMGLGKFGGNKQWYYFSGLQSDEVLVFNGFDSRAEHSLNILHSAFSVPAQPGQALVPRESIEARFFAYFK